MSKLSKKDFDTYLGSEKFYTDQDKKEFYQKLKKPARKTVHWFPQIMTASLVIGLFFLSFQMLQGNLPFNGSNNQSNQNQPGLNPNIEPIKTANSMEEVDAYLEEKTPGLKRAEELGFVTEVNQSFPLANGMTLHLDKYWYTLEDMFIFYSIDIPKKDANENLDAYGLPHLSRISLEADPNELYSEQTLQVYGQNFPHWDGILYENRYYSRTIASSIRSEDYLPFEQLDTIANATLTVTIKYDNYKFEDVELPIQYNRATQPVITESNIDQGFDHKEFSLVMDRVDFGIEYNMLYGKITTKEDAIFKRMDGSVKIKPDEFTFFTYAGISGEGEFQLHTSPFNTIPEEVTINIRSVDFISNHSINFSLDVSDYAEKLETAESYNYEIKEKIDTILDTDIYLKQVHSSKDGVSFTISYQPTYAHQKKILKGEMPTDPRLYDNYNPDENLPQHISATNDKGEDVIMSSFGSGPDEQFYVFIDKQYLENSERIDVTIANLIYTIEVNERITFPITEK